MELLTTAQAAAELDLTTRRIQALCKEGRLGQKVGGRYIITKDDLDRFKKIPRTVGKPKAAK